MNVKGIMPIVGSNCATKKTISRKVLAEKPDAFEKKTVEEKKAPAERPQEPIYYIVERKTRRAKPSYGEPKEIRFK